jgi:hypothetical protein
LLSIFCLNAQEQDKTLWYKQPAKMFEESLVLGNGRKVRVFLGELLL